MITRIDDLENKKTYSSQDANWQEIQREYFTVSGGQSLRDGHMTWVFHAQNNHRARVIFETRIFS